MKFYSNSDNFEFTTIIRDIVFIDGKTYIELEESSFYPESGGQVADSGVIGNKKVINVIEKDGRVLHEVEDDTSIFLGMRLKCLIDYESRMENSRLHTGQHLLSAILENDYKIKTTSFSMSKGYATIDTDEALDPFIKKEIINKVNDAILEGIEVTKTYTKSSELEKYGLRKLIKAQGDIQLIKIGNLDLQGCCGTHVDNTKELRNFYIKKIENYKGGSRIYFMYGNSARDYIFETLNSFEEIRREFEVHESEVLFQVKLLFEKYQDETKKVKEIREKLVNELSISSNYMDAFIYKELEDEEELIKMLVNKLILSNKSGILVDLRQKRAYGFTGRVDLNLGKFFKENKSSKIRGGGGKNSFQAVSDDEETLINSMRTLKNQLRVYLEAN